jgi:hypothetical protein
MEGATPPFFTGGTMDTLSFLQRVLPSEGFYVTTVINKDAKPRQGYFSTVDDLAKAVIALDERGDNTYFAISSFTEKGNRKQTNVRATKVIAFDVDCGTDKPYPSWREGLLALGEFTKKYSMPKPMVVHSGNGLHVYWSLDVEATPDEWKPVAEAMKTAAISSGFEIDPAVPADSARVLRPVGTHNPKSGTVVKLLIDAPETTLDTLRSTLDGYVVATRPRPVSTLAQSLVITSDAPASNATVVATKCQQIKWAVTNQSEVSEPMWYALMGVAAYCQDPEATAMSWSENHPTYDAANTIAKMNQWRASTTGPAMCVRFENARSKGCDKCKYKDKIGTPARLGVQFVEVAPASDTPDPVANEITIPRPFKRTTDGIKMTIDDTDIEVCKFDIYPVSYGKDESLGYETVRYHWRRPHKGWQELTFRQAYLTDSFRREFASMIADQGIVLYGKAQTENFQFMLRTYMEELRQKRAMTNLYTTMGWKENFSQFVMGDTVLRKDISGDIVEDFIPLSSSTQHAGQEMFGTAGTLEQAVAFTNLLERANLHAHMFAVGVSLSSVLYAFTGLKGIIVSLYGPTGSGKTLAQLWQQSIWGNPERLHFAAKFTQNTLFARLGMYSHLPMTIDEVTLMNNSDVGDFAYWVTQGRDKARLNRNATERTAKEWATTVTVSTNKSLASKLITSGLDTDAQMARILEVSMSAHSMFTNNSNAGRKIHGFVTSNYGLIGREFIKKLLELGPTAIRAMIAEASETFSQRYNCKFSGQERYYEQAVILADLALQLARDWELIDFSPRLATDWVLLQMGAIRRTAADSRLDSFDLIAEYMADNASAAVTVFHTGAQRPTPDYNRIPRGEIRIRYDIFRNGAVDPYDKGIMLLDRTHFRKWLSVRGGDYKSVMADIELQNADATPKSNKSCLGRDTPVKLGQTYVVGINLNHPRMRGVLDAADQAAEDLAYGQLKAVT